MRRSVYWAFRVRELLMTKTDKTANKSRVHLCIIGLSLIMIVPFGLFMSAVQKVSFHKM